MANSAATKKPFRKTKKKVRAMSNAIREGFDSKSSAKDWKICENPGNVFQIPASPNTRAKKTEDASRGIVWSLDRREKPELYYRLRDIPGGFTLGERPQL
jgi:hypothetical protein